MKKNGLLAEFRAFAVKGNVIDLAVGVMIGGAFSTITNSLVNDIVMPFVSMFIGGINFDDWKIVLPNLFGVELETPLTINYGTFLSNVLNFLILAFIVFLIVKTINQAKLEAEKHFKKEVEEELTEDVPKEPTAEELLTEILAEMKKMDK